MLDWKQENEKWYCYKDDEKVKGWIQDEKGLWFHLNDKDASLDTEFFQTATDGDFWFYAYPEKTEKDKNTHYVGECGVGWQEVDGKWYYLCPEKTTNYSIEYPKCSMMTNWYKINEKWYYFLTEKREFDSNTHWKGEMVCGTTLEIDGKEYSFNSDGSLVEDSSEGLVSDDCVSFVKGYEDFYSNAYYDGTGYTDAQLTIGYGTTKASVSEAFSDGINSTITEEKACYYLKQEIEKMAKIIKADLDSKGVTLTQCQADAFYSFSYNCGESALLSSTLYRNVVAGIRDSATIIANFQAWSKAGGQTLQGLYKRRTAEANMFLNGVYDSTH